MPVIGSRGGASLKSFGFTLGGASKPSAPSIGTATRTSGAISIPFTPGFNGGSPVTSYTVTASSGATFTGASSPITATGLTLGTSYTFTVTATNAIGTSSPSSSSNSVKFAQVPGAPTIGTATSTGYQTASVTYTAPAITGGEPISYYVAQASNGSTGSASSGAITVSGLSPGTAYTFTVYAVNAMGNGPMSGSASATTTAAPALTLTSNSTTIKLAKNVAISTPVPTITVSGGVAPVNITWNSALGSSAGPAGTSMDSADGKLTGTPSTESTYSGGAYSVDTWYIRATDSVGQTATGTYKTSVSYAPGQIDFTSDGSWTVPNGVNSVSAVAIGAGGGGGGTVQYSFSSGIYVYSAYSCGAGGGGGGLSYDNFTVAPGQTVTVSVGAGGTNGATLILDRANLTGSASTGTGGGTTSIFGGGISLNAPGGGGGGAGRITTEGSTRPQYGGTCLGGSGGVGTRGTGGDGGSCQMAVIPTTFLSSSYKSWNSGAGSGGGAGGWTGAGGAGGGSGYVGFNKTGSVGAIIAQIIPSESSTGGGGGGGGAVYWYSTGYLGGGQNLLGVGGSGSGGTNQAVTSTLGLQTNATEGRPSNGISGYGGGRSGGAASDYYGTYTSASGAARIIWGTMAGVVNPVTRSYPTTNVQNY